MGGKTDLDSFEQWYTGICPECLNKYEAKSAADDLSGIIFNCKRMFCSGKITLEIDDNEIDRFDEDSPFIVESDYRPKRYS